MKAPEWSRRLSIASRKSFKAFLEELGSIPLCEVLNLNHPKNDRSDKKITRTRILRSPTGNKEQHLKTHKLAVALHFGVYNFVRQHHTLRTTPAVAAGLEEKPWSLEQVVEMTEDYWLSQKAI